MVRGGTVYRIIFGLQICQNAHVCVLIDDIHLFPEARRLLFASIFLREGQSSGLCEI